MNCKEFTGRLDSYLRGNLSEEEAESLEAHYFECDRCFTELKLRERLYSKEISISLKGKKIFSVFSFKTALTFASILLIFLGSAVLFHHYSSHKALVQISQIALPQYIQPQIRSSDHNTGKFELAMTKYKDRDYSGALNILKELKDKSKPPTIFFTGICHMQVGHLDQALTSFNKIITMMNPSYYDEAIFYKGITLLRLNQKEKALQQFKHLTDMFSPFSNKAKSMIEKINKI